MKVPKYYWITYPLDFYYSYRQQNVANPYLLYLQFLKWGLVIIPSFRFYSADRKYTYLSRERSSDFLIFSFNKLNFRCQLHVEFNSRMHLFLTFMVRKEHLKFDGQFLKMWKISEKFTVPLVHYIFFNFTFNVPNCKVTYASDIAVSFFG